MTTRGHLVLFIKNKLSNSFQRKSEDHMISFQYEHNFIQLS